MATTLGTVKTRLQNRLKDIRNANTATLVQMGTDLNQFLFNQMFENDPERFVEEEVYAVATSPSLIGFTV